MCIVLVSSKVALGTHACAFLCKSLGRTFSNKCCTKKTKNEVLVVISNNKTYLTDPMLHLTKSITNSTDLLIDEISMKYY